LKDKMRISFSCELKSKSGKQNFAIRLAKSFKKMGVKIVEKRPDINLVFIKGIRDNCKNILRLDNAWINRKMNSAKKNRKISKTMHKCDGVIYQSQYSKKICNKFIGNHNVYSVIFNGCDPNSFKIKHIHKRPFILTFSRWRPHKRLKQSINGFLDSGLEDKYDLLVCGKPDYIINHKSVVYMGKQSVNNMQKIIAGAKFIVHLAYMDCCPNSVVESLVAGKNILYANSGGMKELVGDNGVCINDLPYNFEMIDLYNPPELNIHQLVRGYHEIEKMQNFPYRTDLFINNIAIKYIDYFNKII